MTKLGLMCVKEASIVAAQIVLVPAEAGRGPRGITGGDTTDTTGNKWLDKHVLLAEVLR